MCDYSLQSVKTRKAAVDDRLQVIDFGTGTKGFTDPGSDPVERVAVCVLPGTEIAFDAPVTIFVALNEQFVYNKAPKQTEHTLARFRQINREASHMHHDALEFPDGTIVLLTDIHPFQTAKVLQLPATPKCAEEAEEQRRVEYVG